MIGNDFPQRASFASLHVMFVPAPKAVAFDLGDTLVEYEGLPPSWESHYPAALEQLARYIDWPAEQPQMREACAVLKRHNTRLNPRSHEVDFSAILGELLETFGARFDGKTDDAATAFFSVFRQRLRCFPDTCGRLQLLRQRGVRIGVLTDVPYGMPRRLVLEDMDATGILGLVDDVVTSVDAGVRKPSPGGLAMLASRLKARPAEMVFVGNERKDIELGISCGCEAVLLDRKGASPDWKQHRTIRTLSEL
jgi:putative hydrolase of the HAD superfamily